MSLTDLSIIEAHNGLKKKDFSSTELTRAYLDRIEKEDDRINSYLSVCRDSALSQAAEIDKKIYNQEDLSALAGIPLAVKDNIMVKGMKNTCASKMLADYIAFYDATCIAKLKNLGAIILGKTNLDEFAMGSSTENSAFGPTKNPCDLKRVAGGSSGGSAAAVAANLCCYALGSDTGGSIRQPASFCGVIGLKPTYGAVSRYGLVAFASSFDQIGPLAKTADDAQLVFESICGQDPKDSTSVDFKIQGFDGNIKGLKIGLPKEYFIEGVEPLIKKIIEQAVETAREAGAEIIDISLPHTKYGLAVYYILAPSEASANLARFDGVKYGLLEEKDDLLATYLETKNKGFGQEVKRRIMIGTYALSAGYYDAYYLKAQKVRTLVKRDFDKAFEKVDVIFSPVSPFSAFKIGEKINDLLSMYLSDIFTVSVNLAGLPAVSVPAGTAENLPVGLQIIGRPFEENKILEISKIYEQVKSIS